MGLGTKLAAAVATLVALATLITSAAGLLSTRKQVTDDVDRFLRERATEIASGDRAQPPDRGGRGRGDRGDRSDGRSSDSSSTDDLSVDEDISLDEAVERTTEPQAVDADADVQILDPAGTIVASIGTVLPIDDRDLELAQRDGPDRIRTVSIDGDDHRVLTRHITGGGAIQIGRSLEQTTQLIGGIQQQMLAIGLVCSVVAAGAGLVLARQTTRPLRQLTASVEQVAATGDLSTTVGLDRSDEIGRLGESFDSMLGALHESRNQQHRLVQDAAHELRTPLTSMKANIDLLAHAPDLDHETQVETIESVRSELAQLQAMFTEIIELATDSRQQVEHQPVDLIDVVQGAVEHFSARYDNPVSVTTEGPTTVSGDRAGLERAIGNLLGNGAKFSPPASPLRVMVNGGAVTVTDRGPGISPGDEERIFDRFYRSVATQALPGSGLGLAIVAKIAADHGGSVLAMNHPAGGATVGFRLPTISVGGRPG